MRLIDADEAIINFGFEWDDILPTRDEFVEFIKKQPTIEAEPVKHGRWVDKRKEDCFDGEEPFKVGMENGEPLASCYCSECGEWLVASDEYSVKGRYCPNCGANMESEGE